MRLTETMIQQMATAESYRRGCDYYGGGAVSGLVRRGNTLQAEVEGSQFEPYEVRVVFDEGGVVSADCTCPYSWGGACKHIVATLLAYLHEPDQVAEKPPMETLLADLDAEQLRTLVLALAGESPDLVDRIENMVESLRNESGQVAPASTDVRRERRTPPDASSIRSQVYSALHSLDRMRASQAYEYVGDAVGEVRRLAEQARPFIEAGDGRSALVILEAVTVEYLQGWTGLDGSSGETGELFADLGELWTEAFLSADLSLEERESWADRLTGWQAELEDYGVDDAFDAAQTAVLQGWDDPHIQRVLKGEASAEDVDVEPAPWHDAITAARVDVLRRQGRYEELLNLAAAEGRQGPCDGAGAARPDAGGCGLRDG